MNEELKEDLNFRLQQAERARSEAESQYRSLGKSKQEKREPVNNPEEAIKSRKNGPKEPNPEQEDKKHELT